MTLLKDSMIQLKETLENAATQGDKDSRCAALATLDADNHPRTRTVRIDRIEEGGVILCITSTSHLFRELMLNPYVAMSFYWPSLPAQANLQGHCVVVPALEADRYWNNRSVAAQPGKHGQWESQSQSLQDTSSKTIASFSRIARPANWQVVRIEPMQLEFSDGNWQRQNGKMRYHRSSDGHWHLEAYQH